METRDRRSSEEPLLNGRPLAPPVTHAPVGESKIWPRARDRQSRMLPEATGTNIITRYWQGGYSLGVSYWGFGVPVNVAAVLLAPALTAALPPSQGRDPGLLFAFFAAFWTGLSVLIIWDLVGLWRSATRHEDRRFKLGKTSVWAGLAQLAVVLAALQFATILVNTAGPQLRALHAIAFLGDPDSPDSSLRLLPGGSEIELTGGIKSGLAADFERMLADAPDVRTIHLTSPGGRAGEAATIGDLIRARGLDTYVASECSSACTLIFVAGRTRTLFEGARLGFHSARNLPGVGGEDPESKRAFVHYLIAAGVDPRFANRTITYAPSDMWYPPEELLLAANVVNRLDDGSIEAAPAFTPVPNEAAIVAFGSKALFEAFNASAPRMAGEVYAAFRRARENGRTIDEAALEVRPILIGKIRGAQMIADDDVLVEFGKLYADQYQVLYDADPELCHTYAYEGEISSDIIQKFSADLQRRENILLELAILTATPWDGTSLETDHLWARLAARLQTTLSAGEYQALASIEALALPQQRADHCSASIALFRLISTLPQHEAAMMMRDILSRTWLRLP